MKVKNRTVGILLLSALALAVLGGIVNGNYSNLGNKNLGYILIFVALHAALLVVGILNIIKKDK